MLGQTKRPERKKKSDIRKTVLPCTEQVEAEPPLGIDDRKRAPEIRRAVERERRGR